MITISDPNGELTLREALALGLMRNPGLGSYAWEVRAAEARRLQAGLWSNPELGAEFENLGGSGDVSGTKSLETTISLAQTFRLGGDMARRRELTGHRARLAGWNYEAARLELLTEITQHYVGVLAAQRWIDSVTESLQLAEQIKETTRKRVEAGDAPEIELLRASIPAATAGVELRRAQRALEAARTQLALMWGQSSLKFVWVRGDLERMAAPPPAAALTAFISNNPEVARWATEISARRAEMRLAQAERFPDITAGIGYRSFNNSDDSALVAGISLPLPLFNRNQGNIEAARLGITSARQKQREAELRLEATLSAVYARMADAYDEAVALRDEILPAAKEAFELTRRTFENGDLAFIDVIDAERTLVNVKIQYFNALTDYHLAHTTVEGLIGVPLEVIAEHE